MIKAFVGSIVLAASLPAVHVPNLNNRLHQILAEVATQPRAIAAAPMQTVSSAPILEASACTTKQVMPSRLLRYGAQFVNAFIVANAVRRGSSGHVLFGTASPLGYITQYAAVDAIADRLDRRASCNTQRTVNVLFGFGALYNAGQTELPR